MRLSIQEARAARQRRVEYEHNMAIEGMFPSEETRRVLDYIDDQRMGYEEGMQYMIEHYVQRGLIPRRFSSSFAAE